MYRYICMYMYMCMCILYYRNIPEAIYYIYNHTIQEYIHCIALIYSFRNYINFPVNRKRNHFYFLLHFHSILAHSIQAPLLYIEYYCVLCYIIARVCHFRFFFRFIVWTVFACAIFYFSFSLGFVCFSYIYTYMFDTYY